MTEQPIILLDLNVTLVVNNEVHNMPYSYTPSLEVYRTWLVDACRDRYTILITSRPQEYRDATLQRLSELEGWTPDEAYFNRWRVSAPIAKHRMLDRFITPRHGTPGDQPYVAVESNKRTRELYDTLGIPAYTQADIHAQPDLLNTVQGKLL